MNESYEALRYKSSVSQCFEDLVYCDVGVKRCFVGSSDGGEKERSELARQN